MEDLKSYFQNRRNLTGLLVLLILILAIPLGIYLAKNTQIFSPKADTAGNIVLADGPCVSTINGERVLICKDVPLRLTNPFLASPSPSPNKAGCDPNYPWKNHGEYVSCVAKLKLGGQAVSEAARSDIGKKNKNATLPGSTASSSARPSVSPSPSSMGGN